MVTLPLQGKQVAGLVVSALAFALIVWRGIVTEADPDLWGHVRFGQDILKLGSLPSVDPYSYLVPNSRWINHEWLSETIFGLLYNTAGPLGLVAFKCFCVVVIAILVWRCLFRGGFDLVRCAEILVVAEVMLLPAMTPLRPNIFTCLILTLLLLVLDYFATHKRGATQLCLTVPVLFAVWANVHGGFVLGLIILSAWWIGALIEAGVSGALERKKAATWLLVAVLPLSLAATMLNPYGPELLRFLLETTSVRRADISEWQALGLTNTFGLYYLAVLVLSALSLVFSRKLKPLSTLAAWFVLACAPQVAYRFLPLFAIGTPILVGPHLADAGYRFYDKLSSKRLVLLPIFTVWAVVVVFSAIGIWSQLSGRALGQIFVSPYMPVDAVSTLKQRNVRGNALVQFNWGEYVIWHLGPGLKIAVDGRRETVYPANVRALYSNFVTGSGDWDALVDKYPTDIVVMEPYVAPSNLMLLKHGWVRVYADNACWMFVRQGSELERVLTGSSPPSQQTGSDRYFP